MKKYFYISDSFYSTVKDSQVLNLIEIYRTNGLEFQLIIVTPLLYRIKFKGLRREKLFNIRNNFLIKAREIWTIRTRNTGLFNQLMLTIQLAILLLNDRKNEIIIQTRIAGLHRPFKILKLLGLSINIVFDYRGAGAEEYLDSFHEGRGSIIQNSRIRRKYNSLKLQEVKMAELATHVLCVSEKLKNYIAELCGQSIFKKSYVIPGSADVNRFLFSAIYRDLIRNLYNLGHRPVIIYAGRLQGFWHEGDTIFKFINGLFEEIPNLFFLCITPDMRDAESLSILYSFKEEQIKITAADYNDINMYLSAADVAIILRRDLMTNNVASPTKVPEYLLNGLPVIISDGIGDFSDFVKRNKFGLVVDEKNLYTTATKELVANLFIQGRNKNIDVVINQFSKQTVIKRVISILKGNFE